jgi:hemerythrin
MEWNQTYSVSVKKFDDQHKKLIELLNQLHDAMKAGDGNTMLGITLQSLISYTGTHFSEEEKLMQANGYPDFAAHKAQHDALVKQVLELQKKYQSGGGVMTMTVMSFLKDWLTKHIQGVDKKYGQHFNAKGIY